jgi:hypothetical protein
MPYEDIDLENFRGAGGAKGGAGLDPVDLEKVGMYSKSPTQKLLEQQRAELDQMPELQFPEFNSNMPQPTMNNGQLIMPAPPTVDGIEKDEIPKPNTIAKDFVNQLNFNNDALAASVKQDVFKFSKNYQADFNNAKYTNQFLKRYEEHPDFAELGFSPFRDNEKLYNENSSWLDEMRRASGQWWTLTKMSFMDAASFGSSDSTNLYAARIQEEAMAIGSSSKEGFTGWSTNFYLNSGFTVGILAELAAEEIVLSAGQMLAGATAEFHGGSANVAIGTVQAARATSAFNKIRKGWQTAKNLTKTLKSFKDMNKFRKFATASAKGIGKFVNPAENLVDFYKNYDKMKDMSKLAKGYMGTMSAYKDIRNISMAFKEGAIEGGAVELEMRDKLMDEFVKENGRIPTVEEAAKINADAHSAGKMTSLINAPTIFLSNKLTFDGLVRGGRLGKFGQDVIQTGFGRKIIMNAKAAPGKVFSIAPSKWNIPQRIMTNVRNPRLFASQSLANVTKYAGANWAEGLQELAQETISGASKDYYLARYNGDATRGGFMAYASNMMQNLGGHDPFGTFMSGFLMGGAIAPISGGIANVTQATAGKHENLNNLILKFKDKNKYSELKGRRDKILNKTVQQLNDMYSKPTDYFSPDLENAQKQKHYQEGIALAEKNGDARMMYDLKDASAADHILTAIQTGKLGTFIERMEDLKQGTEEEIQAEYGMSKAEFDKKMDASITMAKNIEKRYETVQKKYPNPYDHKKFKEGTMEAEQEGIRQSAWDQAVNEMVFMQASFDRALSRKESILNELKDVTELEKVATSEFTHLESLQSLEREIGNLDNELGAIDQLDEVTDPKLKKVQEFKKKKLEALKNYRAAVQKNIYEKKDDNEELTDAELQEITTAFKEYSKVLADESGDFTNVDALERAARNMTDAHFLDTRTKKLNSAVNVLLDPNGFVNQFERINYLKDLIFKQKEQEIKNSLEAFLKLKDTNDMLGELAEELEANNMFVEPKDLMELIKTGKVPGEIYYIQNKGEQQALGEVLKTSPDYAQAIEIFKNYAEHLHGIAIGQFDPMGVKMHRPKTENDKRTYKDLAEQFGFDPDAPSSTVPLVQIIQSIIESEHATQHEKDLAQNFLEIVDRREKVTFVKNAKEAGSYNKNQQTVIDPRYSSNDYGTGQGPALETTILKQEVIRRTLESLENNTKFTNEIEKLRKETGKYYASLSEADRARLFGSENANKIPTGLENNEDFIQASMTDPKFQQMMGMVDVNYQGTANVNSTWKRFLENVLEAIGKLLGGKPNNSALNATLDLITAEIESKYTKVTTRGKKTIKRPGTKRRGSSLTPSELMSIDNGALGEQVIQQFIADNKAREEDGNNPLLPGYAEMTPQEIAATTAFENYLKDPNFSKKERIIRNYKDKAPSAETTTEEAPVTGKPIEVEEISLEDVTLDEYNNWDKRGVDGLSQNTIYKLAQKERNRSLKTPQEVEMLADRETMRVVNDMRLELDKLDENPPRTKSEKMKRAMKDLGYTRKDIREASPAEVQRIILEGLTKEEIIAASTKPSINQIAQQEVAEFNKIMQEQFDSITQYNQLITIKDGKKYNKFKNNMIAQYGSLSGAAQSLLPDTETLMNQLNEMEQQKLEELANSTNFVDINVGEVILLNNRYETQAEVIGKTDDTLTYQFIKMEKGIMTPVEVTIKAEEVNDKIKYAAGSAEALTELESREAETDLDTPEVQDSVNETKEAASDINSPEEIQKDIDAGKNLSKEDRDNNLLDNLCK